MEINDALSASLRSRLHEQAPAWTWPEVEQLLIRVRSLLQDQTRWLQDEKHQRRSVNADGRVIGAQLPTENSSFSLEGALSFVRQGFSVECGQKAEDLLRETCLGFWRRLMGTRCLHDFNNRVSHGRMLAAVDRAIALSRSKGW